MVQYNDLMTAIIKKQITIIGSEKAVRYARRVPGVVVKDDGTVAPGASKAHLASLIQEYKKVAGEVAMFLIRQSVAPLLSQSQLDLPAELK